jgi:putative nucleotidyltransferase with HDIG domain
MSLPSTLPPAAPSSRLHALTELRLLARHGQLELPLLPESVSRVVSLTSDEEATPSRIAAALEADVALTAHILRVANSPIYRPPQPIQSLAQAIARLGFAEIRSLAFAIACRTRVFCARGYEADVRRSFRHSLATALYAQELARGRGVPRDEAFLAGLLHDVGEPVLFQLAADLQRRAGVVLPRAALLSEIHVLHGDVGARLVCFWRLPDAVAHAARGHHDPDGEAPSAKSVVELVAFADVLADFALLGNGSRGELMGHPSCGRVGVSAAELEVLTRRAEAVRATVDALG